LAIAYLPFDQNTFNRFDHSLPALRSEHFQPHQQRAVKTQHQEDWSATWEILADCYISLKSIWTKKYQTYEASFANVRSGTSDKPANYRDWAQGTATLSAAASTGEVSCGGTQSWSLPQDLAK
jgi:hypothetical protein